LVKVGGVDAGVCIERLTIKCNEVLGLALLRRRGVGVEIDRLLDQVLFAENVEPGDDGLCLDLNQHDEVSLLDADGPDQNVHNHSTHFIAIPRGRAVKGSNHPLGQLDQHWRHRHIGGSVHLVWMAVVVVVVVVVGVGSNFTAI
jgi:hypothetical protein